ncbi:MAG: MFS transporter [Pseudorhodoplanes sp.]|nr:MFS transporter [Pseudorhodoplanes sp.]
MTLSTSAAGLTAQRPFVLFLLARICATSALQMLAVSVGWQVYQLTGSAFDLGLIGLAQFVPAVLFALIAGHVADRYHRGRVVRLAQALAAVIAACLAAGTAGGWITREMILALVFALGVARAFELPTMLALLPGLVPARLLARAVAASASANQSATIVGPAVGGLLYALSPTAAYTSAFALYLAAGVLIALIKVQRPDAVREPVAFSILFAGIRFIVRNPVILGAISLDLFAVLLGGVTALLPIFARDVFDVGPWGLGLLRAAPAAGALTIALLLARWPLPGRAGMKMFAAVAIFGIATIVFAISGSFLVAMIALAVLGAADMVSVVVRQTLVPLLTPDDMRGRVNAVSSMFVGTSNQLGDFRAGATAELFGATGAVLLGGIGTLLVVAIWMKLFPALARVDRLDGSP